jgi:endonuclease/exonuclease/phosphatase family metal-dependent hydrolase
VVSLNVLHGHPDFEYLDLRLELIAHEIERLDADIVLLQEVPWRRELGNAAAYLSEEMGMNYVYWRANGNRWAISFEEGEAILSRYPLKDVSVSELKPQAGFFENRIVLRAVAQTPIGDIDLYVTHLTHGEAEINQGQVEALMQFVERTSRNMAIVAGDFNAREGSPHIMSLGDAWVDSYRLANPGDRGYTCCVGDLRAPPGEILEKRIDYIFVLGEDELGYSIQEVSLAFNAPYQVLDGWLWASDHAGLMLTIKKNH